MVSSGKLGTPNDTKGGIVSVSVKQLDAHTFEVAVSGRTNTIHTVTVTPDYAEKITAGQATTERLIARSFDFLLEREPNTSILRSFELPVIARYFPEYERIIRGMVP
jgi:hypothetical protein